MESDYESLLRQVEKLNNLPPQHAFEILDLQKRRELRKKLRKLSVALEDHGDIVDRIVYSVRIPLCVHHILQNPKTYD